ncbi:MAG: DUF819 family protein [Acidobacteriota bacterium]|nr:DUF819 family protein [Acidobacteriota bacterium]
MIQEPLAVVAVLLGVVFLSLRLVGRYPWAERVSAILWIIFGSALASNLGLIPKDAPVYGALVDFAVPFAVCVILFTVNLSDVRRAGGPMLAAFALASLGTVLGVLVASLALEPFLARILAAESWKLAGPYTGTFIGGSLNFFALWQGLEIGNPDLFAAANAVDNLTLFPLYACWMVIPTLLADRWIVAKRFEARFDDDDAPAAAAGRPRLVPVQVAALFFLAVGVMAASGWLKTAVVDRVFPELPAILIVTTLALALGQLPFVRRLEGAWEIGDLAFCLFFAAVGALIDFYQAVVLSPILFLYVTMIMAVHMVVLFGGGRWLRMDLGVLTIASVATKAGPALVAPVAETKGWRHLVLPGIVVAMLGYAVGNYVGYAVAQAVRAAGGG